MISTSKFVRNICFVTGLIMLLSVPAFAGTTRVSLNTDGTQSNGHAGQTSISADGRFVAYKSDASTLVDDDTNNKYDIFVTDRDADGDGIFDESGDIETIRASVKSDGTQGNDTSAYPAISADGRYVTFTSWASNLVPNDTNGVSDVFVHDRVNGTTVRVSVNSNGTQLSMTSVGSSISADGRFVAFTSYQVSWEQKVYVHDRDYDEDGIFDEQGESGAIKTVLVSVNSSGVQANDSSSSPAISADGRYVAFFSYATNLVSGDTNGLADVFVHDRDADEDGIFDESGAISTVRVNVSGSGTQSNGPLWMVSPPDISADGRLVAFMSSDTSIVQGDSNGAPDVFVHDRDTDGDGIFDESGAIETVIASVSTGGSQGNNQVDDFSISASGRLVAFSTIASNLVSGDTNSATDVFVHDLYTGMTERVSLTDSGGQANYYSGACSINEDGTYVAFSSQASNLVSGDTNNWPDVFVRSRSTIEIVEAVYDYVNDTLTVAATTDYGADADLELAPYGLMTWDGNESRWEITVGSVTAPPDSIKVCGFEGCTEIR